MNPSTDDRIGAMISTLENVVLPSLDGQDFAADQLRLVLRHLAVLREQEPYIVEFESIRLRDTASYARRVVAVTPTTATTSRLAELVPEDAPIALVDIRRATAEILEALAATLADGSAQWSADVADEISLLTREYEASDAYLGRVFFQGFGFEDGTDTLPSLRDFVLRRNGGIE